MRQILAVTTALAALVLSSPAHADDLAELKKVAEWAKSAAGGACDFPGLQEGGDPSWGNAKFNIEFKYVYDLPEDLPHNFTLYQLHCYSGAYNLVSIFVTVNDMGSYELLSFAEPSMDVKYKDMDTMTELDGKPKLEGWISSSQLVNAEFDPKTNTITALSKYRGLGDAWSSGTWTFQYGRFMLTNWEFDPIYELNKADASVEGDANMDRPEDIIKVVP